MLGLQARPELNGRLGMVTAAYSAASARLQVQVQGEPRSVALRPANLEESELPLGCRAFIAAGGAATGASISPKKARKKKAAAAAGGCGKAKKKPPVPKKPLNAYQCYSKEQMPLLQATEEHKEKRMTELTPLIAAGWKAVKADAAQLAAYALAAEADKARYSVDVGAFRARMEGEGRSAAEIDELLSSKRKAKGGGGKASGGGASGGAGGGGKRSKSKGSSQPTSSNQGSAAGSSGSGGSQSCAEELQQRDAAAEDEQMRRAVRVILASADLEVVTSKTIRRQLVEKGFSAPLKRKLFVNEIINEEFERVEVNGSGGNDTDDYGERDE